MPEQALSRQELAEAFAKPIGRIPVRLYQKRYFSANCIWRMLVAVLVMRAKFAGAAVVLAFHAPLFGFPHCG